MVSFNYDDRRTSCNDEICTATNKDFGLINFEEVDLTKFYGEGQRDEDKEDKGTDLGTSEVDIRIENRNGHACLDSRDFTSMAASFM